MLWTSLFKIISDLFPDSIVMLSVVKPSVLTLNVIWPQGQFNKVELLLEMKFQKMTVTENNFYSIWDIKNGQISWRFLPSVASTINVKIVIDDRNDSSLYIRNNILKELQNIATTFSNICNLISTWLIIKQIKCDLFH